MDLFKTLKSFFVSENNTRSKRLNKLINSEVNSDAVAIKKLWPDPVLSHKLEQAYYQYFIGVNSLLDLELNGFEKQILMSLEQNLHDNQQTLSRQIPRLPDITPKLIHLLRNHNFSWKEVAQIIARDPVLLVEIVKLANSSRFNLQASEDKLEHILVQLGVLEVRKVIIKSALKPIMLFEGGHFLKHSGSKIWSHSIKTAEVCQLIAKQQKQDPFEAYLSGLLHNLGMTIVVQTMNKIPDFNDVPRSILFKDKLLTLSRYLTVLIAQSWEINQSVIQAISEQIDTSVVDKSQLGQLLYQAISVSMLYTLENENRWVKCRESETESYMFYNHLKHELDLLNMD